MKEYKIGKTKYYPSKRVVYENGYFEGGKVRESKHKENSVYLKIAGFEHEIFGKKACHVFEWTESEAVTVISVLSSGIMEGYL